ncbi:MAG: hypothetical protein ACYDBT_09845 [Desulfobulbaceae bacterium]
MMYGSVAEVLERDELRRAIIRDLGAMRERYSALLLPAYILLRERLFSLSKIIYWEGREKYFVSKIVAAILA